MKAPLTQSDQGILPISLLHSANPQVSNPKKNLPTPTLKINLHFVVVVNGEATNNSGAYQQ